MKDDQAIRLSSLRPLARRFGLLLIMLFQPFAGSARALAGETPVLSQPIPAPAATPATLPTLKPLPPLLADGALRYDLRIDVPISVGAGVAWVVTQALQGSIVSKTCLVCERNPDGSDAVNPVDSRIRSALIWQQTGAADVTSSVLAFAVAPLLAGGLDLLAAAHEGKLRRWPVDGLLIIEAALIAADLNQAVKYAVQRERPFVHVLPLAEKGSTANPSDNNVSFYSGHTTLAFSLAVAAGTIASLQGYRLAPLVWAAGLAVAGTVGYLRIAADRHYFTDVLTGALVGSAVGVAVPYLHRARLWRERHLSVSGGALPGGAALALGGVF